MATKKLKEFGQARGWYEAANSVFGVYRGYLVNIFGSGVGESPAYKMIQVNYAPIDAAKIAAVNERLLPRKKEIKFSDLAISEGTLAMTFAEKFTSTKLETLEKALDEIIDTIIATEISPHFSGVPDSSWGHYVRNGAGLLMPQDEYRSLHQQIERDREKRDYEAASYGQGALGAALFGMIGVAAWVALAYFTNYITTLLAFVIAFLAVYGYKQFNGKLGPLTKPLLILVNVGLMVAAVFFTFWASFQDYGLGIADTYEAIVYEPEIRNSFLIDLGMAMLFAVIAIFVTMKTLDIRGDYIEPAVKL